VYGITGVMNDGYTRKTYLEVLQMDAYELRQYVAYRIADSGASSTTARVRFGRDVARLAKMAGMTVEAVLTELHEDADSIE